MMFNRNFLQCFCVATTVVLCCDSISVANTSESGNTVVQQAITIAQLSTSSNKTKEKLCPKGYYVSQCGNYRVGFNWLKSASFPATNSSSDEEVEGEGSGQNEPTVSRISTKNYYFSDDVIDLFQQMRKFFGHPDNAANIPTLYYLDANDEQQTAESNEYEADRELILSNVCHPALSVHKCEKCPNDANVPESYVNLDGETNQPISNSWHFYTIADCYMDEFEDSTGTYVFVPALDNINISQIPSDDHSAEKCYYTSTNPIGIDIYGDEIGEFNPGLNTSHINIDFGSSIQQIPRSNFLR